ncbi:17859_t:CDS:1 [Acaulospora morrowiae]|uniref:17859_t:CDS:1 n=1 Tax=Acaulospora morrowiae TaxID=94023 RepID=A0A9N9HC18_9GLOM|nr:17859_t:CDS:1 [Acaulospora morrowiae]
MSYHKDKSVSSNISLLTFPNEILRMIFEEFDFQSLISLSNVCNLFQEIAKIYLAKTFKKNNISLLLGFEQEHKRHFNVDFEFYGINKKNGNFIFKPKTETLLKFSNSPISYNPSLWRIILNVDGEYQPDIRSSSLKAGPFRGKLLQEPCRLSVKNSNSMCQKTKEVYRVGNGSCHLRVPYWFSYSVTESTQRMRTSERWITPQSFECSSSFFYPNESAAHRVMRSIFRHNSNKKPSTKIIPIKGKEPLAQLSEPREVLIIQNEPPKKKSTRWVCGARS